MATAAEDPAKSPGVYDHNFWAVEASSAYTLSLLKEPTYTRLTGYRDAAAEEDAFRPRRTQHPEARRGPWPQSGASRRADRAFRLVGGQRRNLRGA